MTTLVIDNFLDERYSDYFSKYYQDDLEVFKASKLEFPGDIDKYAQGIKGIYDAAWKEGDWIQHYPMPPDDYR